LQIQFKKKSRESRRLEVSKLKKRIIFGGGTEAFLLVCWGWSAVELVFGEFEEWVGEDGFVEFLLEEFASVYPLWEVLVIFFRFCLFESLVCCSGEGYYASLISVVFGESFFL